MPEIRALTGLRGVAALTVFFAHLRENLIDNGFALAAPDWFVRLFLSGGRQVDIFFVLSGFILTMNYRAWFADTVTVTSYLTFMRRRLARIYPLFFVILLLVIGFVVAARLLHAETRFGLDRFRFEDLPAHFLLMHAWGIFSDGPGNWNTPSWSISIETLAYLLFPFAVWLGARRWLRNAGLRLALAIAIGFGLNALTPWGLAGFAGIARGLSEFLLGCVVMDLYGGRAAAWLQTQAGSLAAAALLIVCYLLTPDTGFVIALCVAPLLLALCHDNVVSRMLAWQPVFFLGEISYSIYLGHFLFSAIAYRLVSMAWMRTGALQTAAGLVIIVGFVLTVSTFFFYAVERPGRDLLSGRRRRPTVD